MTQNPQQHNIRVLRSAIATPHNDTVALVGNIPSYFSVEECQRIMEMVERLNLGTSGTGGVGKTDEIRKSNTTFMAPDQQTQWIFDKLEGALEQFNKKYFNFDLSGFFEGFQIARYDAPDGHYGWHVDLGTGRTSTRKLSLSVQLSDPNSYTGGGLEFFADDIKLPREQGSLIVFPAFLAHRVTPVTEGCRFSLVSWVGGPPFR
jgi:PKHD-type hydroxylase